MPEEIAKYTFLPWFRQGVSRQINEVDKLGGTSNYTRASFDVKLKVSDGANEISALTKKIHLVGPGDITGINKDVVIKMEPYDGITNFEPNYIPYIEFYEEDFPWRYSPAKANNQNKLRPWLVLLVLEESEFSRPSIINGQANVIQIPESTPFPDHTEAWAWAHVHINETLTANGDVNDNNAENTLQSKLDSNPNIAHSRLFCPRKLKENTSYTAFLLPAYEQGRLAGLNAEKSIIESVSAQQYAYGNTQTDNELKNYWPIYFEWSFRTGDVGDFEYLVKQIKPRFPDPRVGRLPIDTQDVGYLLSYQGGDGDTQGTVYLEGALKVPDTETDLLLRETTTEARNFVKGLSNLLNLNEDLKEDTLPADSQYLSNPFFLDENGDPDAKIEDDPIITPPIYGRWHNMVKRTSPISKRRWINQLNLEPGYRTASGFGTKVIQANQETYMDRAWEQFGEVLEANKKMRAAQLAQQLNKKLYERNIERLANDKLVGMTHKLHTRLRNGEVTLKKTIENSNLTSSVLDPGYTKMTRPSSPIFNEVSNSRIKALHGDTVSEIVNNKVEVISEYGTSSFSANLDLDTLQTGLSSIIPANFASTSLFMLSVPNSGLPISESGNQIQVFSQIAQTFNVYFHQNNWDNIESSPALSMSQSAHVIHQGINPKLTIGTRLLNRLNLGDLQYKPKPEKIVPAMAYPKFNDPMYKALADLSEDYLIPNLDLIPQDTFTVLETNQEFIESFMVGLNHEMGRELLWREYITDQRGSYFRKFWDSVGYIDKSKPNYDIEEIHKWKRVSDLGQHPPAGAINMDGKLVFVIRGELLKKFPNTTVYMQAAKWDKTNGNFDTKKPRLLDKEIKTPVFEAKIDPDIYFLGFDITSDEALGDDSITSKPGWFFVLKERAGEVRFGMDISSDGNTSWNDLSWDNLNNLDQYVDINLNKPNPQTRNGITWGTNAADMAWILYQNPFMMAIHAKEMIRE